LTRGTALQCDTLTTIRKSVSRGYTLNDLTPRFTSVSNIAEQLIDKGLASVVRHKRDDEDRSPDFEKLVAAEQA
jgi:hypothetical protein